MIHVSQVLPPTKSYEPLDLRIMEVWIFLTRAKRRVVVDTRLLDETLGIVTMNKSLGKMFTSTLSRSCDRQACYLFNLAALEIRLQRPTWLDRKSVV